ncbi:hypothetical protein E2C01_035680 [Portunus trituberculatus]|uniref:Uncharacterized protein n=1 Tax=Portunus trituberculatus TaxID=210409 RepID=A0A5B7F935_PORTR|nr:hypothetical protein [Portunus trituberculatus]
MQQLFSHDGGCEGHIDTDLLFPNVLYHKCCLLHHSLDVIFVFWSNHLQCKVEKFCKVSIFIVKKVKGYTKLDSCFGRLSATLSKSVLVGLSPHSTTSCTLVSPLKRRPFARMPTRITPFSIRGGPSSFFSLMGKESSKSSFKSSFFTSVVMSRLVNAAVVPLVVVLAPSVAPAVVVDVLVVPPTTTGSVEGMGLPSF